MCRVSKLRITVSYFFKTQELFHFFEKKKWQIGKSAKSRAPVSKTVPSVLENSKKFSPHFATF